MEYKYRAMTEKDKTIERLQDTPKSSRDILNIIDDMHYKVSEVFRRSIDTIIQINTSPFFGNDEAADIKSVMQSYGETKEQQQAIGTWLCDYADSRQSFDKLKHRQTYKEVTDVANGAYDWKFERGQKNLGY